MRVTEVSLRIDLVPHGSARLRAMGSIVLDWAIRIEYIRLVELPNGNLHVAMPSKLGADGRIYDMAHPITAKLREAISLAVISEYERLKKTNKLLTDNNRSSNIIEQVFEGEDKCR